MKIENYYHTSSKTFIIGQKGKAPSQLDNFFDSLDISDLMANFVKNTSEIDKHFNIDSDQTTVFRSLKIGKQQIKLLKEIFSEVKSDKDSSEVHDQIRNSTELHGRYFLLKRKGETVYNHSIESFIAMNLLMYSLRAYKFEKHMKLTKYLFPLIQGKISGSSQPDKLNDMADAPFAAMPILTLHTERRDNVAPESENFATLSFFTFIEQNNLPPEFVENFTDTYEGDIFRLNRIQVYSNTQDSWLGIKQGEKITVKTLFDILSDYCETKLKLFIRYTETSGYRKQLSVNEYSSLSGRILTDDENVLPIPDFRFFRSNLESDYVKLLQYAQGLLKVMRYKRPDKEFELRESIESLGRIITRREDDSITFFSKKSNRIVSFASFNDNYPFRSYFRFAILNMLRAETLGLHRITLLNLNNRLAEMDFTPPKKAHIKSTISKIGSLLNLDSNDDFVSEEIPALQELSGINTLSDRLLVQSNLLLSLRFYENEERIMKYQLFMSVLLSVLTTLLLLLTVYKVL